MIQGLRGGETLLPPCLGKQLLERAMWVAVSTDKLEGFLLGRNAHRPHLLQPSKHPIMSGRVKGAAVPGSRFSCVWLQQPVYCDDSICVPCVLFELAAGKKKGNRFTPVCTGWCLQPHPSIKASQRLAPKCLYLPPTPTPTPPHAKARCGNYFLFVGQPGVAGILPIPVLLTSPGFESKGRLRRLPSLWDPGPGDG